jgi:hypothetical protein
MYAALNLGVEHKGSPSRVPLRLSGHAEAPTPLGLVARVAGRLCSLTPGIPTLWLWRAASTSRCYMAR